MVMTQYYAVSGSTHYILTFEYPAGISDFCAGGTALHLVCQSAEQRNLYLQDAADPLCPVRQWHFF